MDDIDVEKDFEDDIAKASTPRLRLVEAQALDNYCGDTKTTTTDDDNAFLIEDMLQDRSDVRISCRFNLPLTICSD
jgi:hypothetical protein